jgi:hypothetical protein
VFVGVAYFGQVLLVWYLGLGFIGSLTPDRRRRPVKRLAHRRHDVRPPQLVPA